MGAIMTKADLFKKYSINDSHARWDPMIDNWMSVEVYRIMHDGQLPPPNDYSCQYITDFLDACNDGDLMRRLLRERPRDAGSLYLTAKRMVYRYADMILREPKL